GARLELPRQYAERAVYLVSGAVEVVGRAIDPLRMAVFADGDETVIEAQAPSVLMLLGGDPVGNRFIEWNFVSSSRPRIEQAMARAIARVGFLILLTTAAFCAGVVPDQPLQSTGVPWHDAAQAVLRIAWWLWMAWVLVAFLRAFVIVERRPREGKLLQDLLAGL